MSHSRYISLCFVHSDSKAERGPYHPGRLQQLSDSLDAPALPGNQAVCNEARPSADNRLGSATKT